MYFAFKAALNHFIGQKTRWNSRSKPRSQQCKLVGEQLESRYALSTLDDSVPDLVPPITPDPPAETPENQPPPSDPPPLDPPPSDPPVNPPSSGGGNAAPVIHDFALTTVDNWCTVRGWVSDDQDPSTYIVGITGVVIASVSIGADHYFSYVFQFDPELHGPIYAQTVDFYGLLSNEPVVNL